MDIVLLLLLLLLGPYLSASSRDSTKMEDDLGILMSSLPAFISKTLTVLCSVFFYAISHNHLTWYTREPLKERASVAAAYCSRNEMANS